MIALILLYQLKNFITKFIESVKFNLIILADDKFEKDERIYSFIKIMSVSGPFAFVLNLMGAWFNDNQVFAIFVIAAIIINAAFGAGMHLKRKSFRFIIFLKKTGIMVAALLLTYVGIEMVLIIAKQNIVTDVFRIALQVTTILYPFSKVFKNVYILTNGEYPPKWIMEKVYNFQSNGDLRKFLENNNNINNQNQQTDGEQL